MAPLPYQKFQPFVAAWGAGVHDFANDQLAVAFLDTVPLGTESLLADLSEVPYTYATSRDLTTVSFDTTAGVLALVVDDLTVGSNGGDLGPWQAIAIYNATAAGSPLVCFFDYGEAITQHDGDAVDLIFDVSGLFDLT